MHTAVCFFVAFTQFKLHFQLAPFSCRQDQLIASDQSASIDFFSQIRHDR
jgi:hypothetical protein